MRRPYGYDLPNAAMYQASQPPAIQTLTPRTIQQELTPMQGFSVLTQGNMPQGYPPAGALLEQPNRLFRYGEQTLWSSQFLPGATAVANQSFRLFTTPIGQVGQGFSLPLSRAETNLTVGGQLPQAQAFDVFGVALQIAHSTAAVDGATLNAAADTVAEIQDLLDILNNVVVQWVFSQTFVDIAPAMLVGQGGGAFGALSGGATGGHMNNGNGACWLYRQYPVALPALVVFGVQLIFGSRAAVIGANALSLRVALLGYFKNLVEAA